MGSVCLPMGRSVASVRDSPVNLKVCRFSPSQCCQPGSWKRPRRQGKLCRRTICLQTRSIFPPGPSCYYSAPGFRPFCLDFQLPAPPCSYRLVVLLSPWAWGHDPNSTVSEKLICSSLPVGSHGAYNIMHTTERL